MAPEILCRLAGFRRQTCRVNNMREKLMAAIREHAAAEYPRECCGVVVQAGRKQRYIRCENISDKPEEHFTLSPADYLNAEKEGEIIMVVHSHPDVAQLIPSETDRIQCDHSGLEWGIISWPDGDWCTFSPRENRDYTGRSWVLGHADCWALIREYYRREFNLSLGDYSVPREWWNNGENLYDDNWQSEGFIQVELNQMQPGDIIMMQLSAPVTNHAAIWLGNNIILHHSSGNLSARVPYGQYYRERTVRIVRHKELMTC